MNYKVLVLMADGFEDVEAVTPIDYLSRAGSEVITASVKNSREQCDGENLIVTSKWGGIKLIADTTLTELVKQGKYDFDAVIIPGGIPGALNLAASEEANELIKEMAAAGKLICAICASPAVVLAPLGLISGRNYTCYPGFEEKVKDGKWSAERVVVDGNIITSRGAGTAGLFSIAIINKLFGESTGKRIANTLLL